MCSMDQVGRDISDVLLLLVRETTQTSTDLGKAGSMTPTSLSAYKRRREIEQSCVEYLSAEWSVVCTWSRSRCTLSFGEGKLVTPAFVW